MTTTDIANAAIKAAVGHPATSIKSKRRMARPVHAGVEVQTDPALLADTLTTSLAAKPEKPLRVTKSANVIALLQREQGATLGELIEATGWLPHTTRAALTGINKKGHVIGRDKRGDVTCYRIAPVAA